MAYVNPLDPTTPLGSDAVSQGDDMFRSVKAALIERMDSFFTGHDVQPWQAKSGSGAASLWIVSDAVEAVTRLAYTGAGSRSVELFANSTVAGLRDTTGPLTILSYTYSSALTVLNTTGSMQLKVGVGQTIQTIVNGVTLGTWSSSGLTIATGTTAVQGMAATNIVVNGAVQNSFTTNGATPVVINNNVTAASYRGMIEAQRGGADRYWIGFDALDQFVLLNAAASAANVTVTDAGAMTVRAGLTVSAGGITVSAGTSSFQAVATAGGIKRGDASGTGACATGVFTSVFTVNATGLWKVFVALPGGGAAYLATAEVLADGPSGIFTVVNKAIGANVDVQMSGSSFQIKQTSGATQTMTFYVLQIA